MPLPPRNPFKKFTCQSCGWSEITYQPSDCILSVNCCKKCQSEDMKMFSANPIESAAAFPLEFARHTAKKFMK